MLGIINIFIGVLITVLVVMPISLFWHEVGHYLFMKYTIKKHPRIVFSRKPIRLYTECEGDINEQPPDLQKGLYVSGILLGIVPLTIPLFFGTPVGMGSFLACTLLYFVGCTGDLKALVEVIKKEDLR